MSKTVFVTGGSGFIGLNLIRDLLNHGEISKIIVFDRSILEGIKVNPKIEFLKGSLENLSAKMFSDLGEIDSAVLLAGISEKNQDPEQTIKINVDANKFLIESLLKSSPNLKVIFPSSQLVYGHTEEVKAEQLKELVPPDSYAMSKVKCEEMIMSMKDKLTYSILRISNPYGPHIPHPQNYNYANQLLFELVNGKKIELFANGTLMKNYIPVQNLCRIISKIIIENIFTNEILNVGHYENYSMKQFFEKAQTTFRTGAIELISKEAQDDPNIMIMNKLYEKINKEELLTTEEALVEFQEFFAKKTAPTIEDFIS